MDMKTLIEKMTLEEKASMCSGMNFWDTQAIEHLGIPKMMVTDGPHGLRKQTGSSDHLGILESVPATCFPSASATACSFDPSLLTEMGVAIGKECQKENVGVILGPGVNIKRSPLCGRNFEYFSEDPYLSGEMAKAHIQGVQSQGVGTSLKHFAANNQEHRRFSGDSVVDERTLREIYLVGFEKAVKEGKPATVMCAYNQLNGTYCAENSYLLSRILRDEWGFTGFVVSDWGAVNDRVASVVAGLELEMPATGAQNDKLIVQAVKQGTLNEDILDQAVERILRIVFKWEQKKIANATVDMEENNQLARKIASESMVLLKNENNRLPLNKQANILFVGGFAEKPRYQGGGSSHIHSYKVTSALDAVSGMNNVTFAKGFDADTNTVDATLFNDAIEKAKRADVCVIFAGLPDSFESEGFDRSHMQLPSCQNQLIDEITQVQPKTIVVLHNGSPVEMPWAHSVQGILEAHLGGQACGLAVTDLLFGDANPSGKLAESYPLRLQDNPSYLFYGGERDRTEYREGVFVGYRYYDKKDIEVLFPFGFGLSYTTFEYTNLKLDKKTIKDDEKLIVTADIKNTGNCRGKEAVQLYVRNATGDVIRPDKELRGFAKVELNAGERKQVSFELSKRAFAYYSTTIKDWHVESGEYEILLAKSSHDIVLCEAVAVESTVQIPIEVTINTCFADIEKAVGGKEFMDALLSQLPQLQGLQEMENDDGMGLAEMMRAMMKYMVPRSMMMMGDGKLDIEQIGHMIKTLQEMQSCKCKEIET